MRTPVQVHTRTHSMVSVLGQVVAEHFAITPELNANGSPAVFGLTLVHRPTGHTIAVDGFPCHEELQELAAQLAALPIDWAAATTYSWPPARRQLVHQALTAWDRNRHSHAHVGSTK
ncbi:hypothetical protein [Nocardia acidivorans]|uniref:hypothetical protein n=1 Tax=Nocardia acidivorans TaxID=404580 RepID=UPI000AE1A65F|nr:hypothetical protein [Nocardia acidivorans]